MIGTIEYRECNQSFPGIRWCIVRTNGEVYPLHKDDVNSSTFDCNYVEFILRSDRYDVGPYGYVTKEISKEDYREHVLNQLLK